MTAVLIEYPYAQQVYASIAIKLDVGRRPELRYLSNSS